MTAAVGRLFQLELFAAVALVLLLLATPTFLGVPAHADPAPGCDARWQACESPRWCETTGEYLPPFSGYCPMGPTNYPPPRLDR
jgi:hypothetical protein